MELRERFHELKIHPDIKVRPNNLTVLPAHESSRSAADVKLKFLLGTFPLSPKIYK